MKTPPTAIGIRSTFSIAQCKKNKHDCNGLAATQKCKNNLVFLLNGQTGKPQGSPQAPLDTTTTQELFSCIFQPIDKKQLPTKFLEEYGCQMMPATTFNGTLTDSVRIDMNRWYYFHYR